VSGRGKGLLILAGMKPKGSAARDEDEDLEMDDDAPPSSKGKGDYEPDGATLDAGADALAAVKDDDPDAYTRALCRLVDAHLARKG
jgi:hypothetical protein